MEGAASLPVKSQCCTGNRICKTKLLVTDQLVYPEIGQFNLQVAPAFLQGVRRVHTERSLPYDIKGYAIEAEFSDFIHFKQIMPYFLTVVLPAGRSLYRFTVGCNTQEIFHPDIRVFIPWAKIVRGEGGRSSPV